MFTAYFLRNSVPVEGSVGSLSFHVFFFIDKLLLCALMSGWVGNLRVGHFAGFFVAIFIQGQLKMSAEEVEKTTTTAAEAPAGDEEEEWLYGGETSFSFGSFCRYLISRTPCKGFLHENLLTSNYFCSWTQFGPELWGARARSGLHGTSLVSWYRCFDIGICDTFCINNRNNNNM